MDRATTAHTIDEWDFLLPWCEKLRGHLQLECGLQYLKRTPSSAKHWELHVNFFPRHNAEARHVDPAQQWEHLGATGVLDLREAFDLLYLTSVVDNTVWKRLLGECIVVDSTEGGLRMLDELFVMPELRIRLDERDANLVSLVDAFTQFFVTAERCEPSPGYQTVRSQILMKRSGMKSELPPLTEDEFPPNPVSVHFEFFPTSSISDTATVLALNRAYQVIDELSQRTCTVQMTRFASKFIVASQSLYAGAVPITSDLSRMLLNSKRSVLYTNWSVSLNADVQLPVKQFETFFQELMTQGEASIGTLSLMFDTATMHHFCCAMSALAYARGISTLTLDGMFESRERLAATQRLKWQWLAFALFSRASSSSSVTKVVLDDLYITWSDIDAIAAVLRTNQPEPRAISADSRPNTALRAPERFVRLHKGGSFRVWPRSTESPEFQSPMEDHRSPLVSYDGIEHTWLQVLDCDAPNSEYISVLVPGFGKCLVSHTSLSDKRSYTPGKNSMQSSCRPISSLSLSFVDDVEIGVLQRLLELVGQHLEYLSISNIGPHRWHYDARDTDEGADLSWIALSCPHLQHLRVADSSIQLESLTACSLLYLELYGCRITESSAVKFANTLKNPVSSISKSLLELSLHVHVNGHHGLSQLAVEQLTAALKSNQRLQFLRVWLPRSLHDALITRLRAFNRQPLPVVRERLPTASKLAFLGCISPTKSSKTLDTIDHESQRLAGEKANLLELNEDVLRIVFAMAATCETRLVDVVV